MPCLQPEFTPRCWSEADVNWWCWAHPVTCGYRNFTLAFNTRVTPGCICIYVITPDVFRKKLVNHIWSCHCLIYGFRTHSRILLSFLTTWMGWIGLVWTLGYGSTILSGNVLWPPTTSLRTVTSHQERILLSFLTTWLLKDFAIANLLVWGREREVECFLVGCMKMCRLFHVVQIITICTRQLDW